jgi:hypothetical protein
VDITGTLAAAISNPNSWDAGGVAGLTLTEVKRDGVWLSPTAPLRLIQTVVPLNIPVERFGNVRLKNPQTFAIETIAAGTSILDTTPVAGEFALGMFLNLSQEEMLASGGYENRDAGVEILRPLTHGIAVTAETGFEELLLDPKKRPDVAPPVLTFPVFSIFATQAADPAVLQVRRERFAVVDKNLVVQATPRTFFEARALLKQGSRIVPEAEVVA